LRIKQKKLEAKLAELKIENETLKKLVNSGEAEKITSK